MFFEYSNSGENTVTPDVVEYDKKRITKPVYGRIIGCNTMNNLGIVLDFEQNTPPLMKSFCQ